MRIYWRVEFSAFSGVVQGWFFFFSDWLLVLLQESYLDHSVVVSYCCIKLKYLV